MGDGHDHTKGGDFKAWTSRKEATIQQLERLVARDYMISGQIEQLRKELESLRTTMAAMRGVLEVGDAIVGACYDEWVESVTQPEKGK